MRRLKSCATAFLAGFGVLSVVQRLANATDCGAQSISYCWCSTGGGSFTLKRKVNPGSGSQVRMSGGSNGPVEVSSSLPCVVSASTSSSTQAVTVTVVGSGCSTTIGSFSAQNAGYPNSGECNRCP